MFESHYDWLEVHLMGFFKKIGIDTNINNSGIISAHGDKFYSYRSGWEEAGVPFFHGAAIMLASYCQPYSKEVRETEHGWVQPDKWVIDNYERFKQFLPAIDKHIPKDVENIKITFKDGNCLMLYIGNCKFYNLKETQLYHVMYGERFKDVSEEESYHACGNEYFAADDYETALKALMMRAASSFPHKSSKLSKGLDELCEPEDKE